MTGDGGGTMECTSDLVGVSDPHIVDPFPILRRYRDHTPIVDVDVREAVGARPTVVQRPQHTFSTLTYEACTTVLQDASAFSSSLTKYTLGRSMGRTMLELDPPEHTGNRALVASAFRPRHLERWTEQVIRPTARALVEEVASTGSAELVRSLAIPLPMMAITRILGLPDSFLPQFEEWAFAIVGARVDPDRAMQASEEFTDYCRGVVAAKRRYPDDDLVSSLVEVEVDGAKLTDDEVMSFMKLLFPAGAETTSRQIGTLLHALVHHPAQLNAVRRDRSLVRAAVEESLRWQSAVGASSPRVATKDCTVLGVDIPEGASVIAGYAIVNRDPARWEEPDRFDIHRPFRPHLAFGSGPHTCLGMHLARVEMAEALQAVLDLLPDVRLDSDAPPQHIHGMVLRGPCAVPVVFEAR